MATEDTTLEAATQFITATPEAALRRAAGRNRNWAKVLRGYRSQAINKPLLLTHVGEFAAAPALLLSLAEAFLDSAGITKVGRLADRLTAAAGREDLPEAVRQVCRQFAGYAPPVTADAMPVPEEATPASEPPEPAKPRKPSSRKPVPGS